MTSFIPVIILILIIGFILGDRYQRISRRWKMQQFRELSRELELDYPPYPIPGRGFSRSSGNNGIPELILIIAGVGAGIYLWNFSRDSVSPEEEEPLIVASTEEKPRRRQGSSSSNVSVTTFSPSEPTVKIADEILSAKKGDYERSNAFKQSHTLQTGNFQQRENALKMIEQLEKITGEVVFLHEMETTNGWEYKVLAGAGPGAKALSGLALQLEKKGIKSFIKDLETLKASGTLTLVSN